MELDEEILFVDLLEPGFFDLVHAHVHGDESFVDGGDVIESLFLEEINFSNDLSGFLRGDNSNNFAEYFLRGFVHHFKVNLIFVNASVSIFSLCCQVTINLFSFYPCKPFDSLIELDLSSIKSLLSLSS